MYYIVEADFEKFHNQIYIVYECTVRCSSILFREEILRFSTWGVRTFSFTLKGV